MAHPEVTSPSPGDGKAGAKGICVIMAGGRGTRFWPLSRRLRPKQLLDLTGSGSLLRATFERVAPLVGADRILVITGADLADAVKADLPEIPADHIVGEPVGRNTAPCAVLGIALAARIDPDAPVALLPADHHIPDGETFRAQLREAFSLAAAAPTVVTLGVKPDRPATGYGYIETAAGGSASVLKGLGFVEKPDLATAEAYLAGGRHYWNSGMFVWNAAHFAVLADRHLAEVRALMQPAAAALGTEGWGAALTAAYEDCPAESIDYAVMEKLEGFEVIPAGFEWHDLGSWDAWAPLAAALPGDNRGDATLAAIDARGNIVRGTDRLIALIGVDDLVVVDTPDALLVCRKEDAQRIKEMIDHLAQSGHDEVL